MVVVFCVRVCVGVCVCGCELGCWWWWLWDGGWRMGGVRTSRTVVESWMGSSATCVDHMIKVGKRKGPCDPCVIQCIYESEHGPAWRRSRRRWCTWRTWPRARRSPARPAAGAGSPGSCFGLVWFARGGKVVICVVWARGEGGVFIVSGVGMAAEGWPGCAPENLVDEHEEDGALPVHDALRACLLSTRTEGVRAC